MQTIETQINKLEAIVAEIDRINADLQKNTPESEHFHNGIYKILELIEDDDEDDDYNYDTDDSDISFTEEEREIIESEEHYAFLKRYSLKPTAETPFIPAKTNN
jgi:hypothetical protein